MRVGTRWEGRAESPEAAVRWEKWASLDPGGPSAAGLGRPTGWFMEETGMFMCSPVYMPCAEHPWGEMYSLSVPLRGLLGVMKRGMPSL